MSFSFFLSGYSFTNMSVAATGLCPPTASVLDFSEITQSFNRDKLNCISQLTKDESGDF